MEYLRRGRPTRSRVKLLTELTDPLGIRVAPKMEDMPELANEGSLFEDSDVQHGVVDMFFENAQHLA